MKCANCSAELNADDRFCIACGHPVQATAPSTPGVCPNCKAKIQPDARFCDECGQNLGAREVPAAAVVRPTDPIGEIRRFEGHLGAIIGVTFSPDGRRVLSASEDQTIRFWDVESGQELRRLSVGSISFVAFSSDCRRALSSGDGPIRLWDLESGREIRRFEGRWATGLAFSPNGEYGAFCMNDKSIRLVELTSGRELHRIEDDRPPPRCVAISSDGRRVLSGANEPDYCDHAVLMWDVERRELCRPEREMMLVASVAFSPDGHRALAACLDARIYLWDVESGQELRLFEGHTGNIFCAVFSPDGRRLLSSSGTDYFDADLIADLGLDNTIRLWDVASGQELHRFEGHFGNVNCVAFSPDGRRAISGSKDKSVRLWGLPR